MAERMCFATEGDVGLQVTDDGQGGLAFCAHDDWCGDTQSGIGASVSVGLTYEEVVKLHAEIGKWIEDRPEPLTGLRGQPDFYNRRL